MRDIDHNSGVYECLLLAVMLVVMGAVVLLEWLSEWLGRNDWILRWLLVLSVSGLIAYIALSNHGTVLLDSNGNPFNPKVCHWQDRCMEK